MECKRSDMCHDKPWLVAHCVKQQNMLLLQILPPPPRIHQSILHLCILRCIQSVRQGLQPLVHSRTELSAFRALCACCSACTGKASKQPIFEEAPVIPPFILLSSLKHEKSDKQQTHHSFKINLHIPVTLSSFLVGL